MEKDECFQVARLSVLYMHIHMGEWVSRQGHRRGRGCKPLAASLICKQSLATL